MKNELEVLPRHTDAPISYAQPGSLTTAERGELSVQEVVAHVGKVQEIMRAVMKEGVHYGKIPGVDKPTLLKPGAELLCLVFRLDPQYQSKSTYEGRHLTVESTCTLYHITSGARFGSGQGSCSTKESRYAWRKGSRKCPKCNAEAIIKGQAQYGGGWICWKKKDGCGAKFKDDDASITSQETGRVPNEDLEDQHNIVLKMSNKRSLVAATLNVTGASATFTQDVEDARGAEPEEEPRPVFRPTEEQLQRSRESAPEPHKTKAPDVEEGFGPTPDGFAVPDYAAMGAPIRKAQVTMFKQRCEKRADAVGVTSLTVERAVLSRWNLTRVEELGQKIFPEALLAAEGFEPDYDPEPGDRDTTSENGGA